MRAEEHYLRLRTFFQKRTEGEPVEVTREQLAEIFACTDRNAHLLIKKMEEQNWLRWHPGRGRGHRSQLVFWQSPDQLQLATAKQLVEDGQLSGALSVVEKQLSSESRATFFQWLSNRFGVQVEQTAHRRIDTLRYPFYRPLPHLDPVHIGRRTEAHMIQQVCDGLATFDSHTQSMQPAIAHHWDCDATGRVWTFYLRKGVLFHHGRELTARDVEYTFQRLLDPAVGSPYRRIFQGIERIEIVSDTTLSFYLQEPNHLFHHYIGMACAAILPHDCSLENLVIGAGPWKLVQNDEEMLVLEAHSAYYKGRPHLDRVELWVIPELIERESTRHLGGENVTFYPFRSKERSPVGWKHTSRIEAGCTYFTCNMNRPGPQQSSLFRRALQMGIDRARLLAELEGERAYPASSFLWSDEQAREVQADPEAVRELLRAAGYEGTPLRLYTYQLNSNEENAAWLQQEWAALGIEVDVSVLPIQDLVRPERMAECDLLLSGMVCDNDVELSLINLYQADNSFIRNHLDDARVQEIDTLLQRLHREPSPHVRRELLNEAEQVVKRDHHTIFLYHAYQGFVYHPSLQGVTMNSHGWVDFQDLWYQDRPLSCEPIM